MYQKGKAQMYVKEILHDKIPITYTGKAIDAYEYKDAAGLHIYLVTKSEDERQTTIHCYGYTQVNQNFIKDWEIKDFSGIDVRFHYPYTKIGDIDKDGIYESVFVYQLDPDAGEGETWKVMLLYKNKKYVLRVHIPTLDNDRYNESYNKSFDEIPASVKTYIAAYWKNIAKQQELRGTEWYKIH
jgi:hypothetical protein